MSPSPSTTPSADGAHDRKAVLFCQDCGHASPLDGDWHVRTADHHQRIHCPECGRVVDDRRLAERPLDADEGDVPPSTPTPTPTPTPVQWCVDAWSRYWSTWTTLLVDGPSVAESDC